MAAYNGDVLCPACGGIGVDSCVCGLTTSQAPGKMGPMPTKTRTAYTLKGGDRLADGTVVFDTLAVNRRTLELRHYSETDGVVRSALVGIDDEIEVAW